jgi:hypothetical protein
MNQIISLFDFFFLDVSWKLKSEGANKPIFYNDTKKDPIKIRGGIQK